MLVAGVDSSTQSTKVLLCQAEDGAIVGQAAAPHPDGTECDPELWWQALATAGDGLLGRADASQHENLRRAVDARGHENLSAEHAMHLPIALVIDAFTLLAVEL